MKRLIAGILLFAVVAAADRGGLFGRRGGDDIGTYHRKSFTVVGVVDGDTLDVNCPDRRRHKPTTRVRLLGVDTPETKRPDTPVQHFGPEASAFTARMTERESITLLLAPNGRTRGNYGRLLAYVTLPDGRMLNRILVSEGYAYADPRFDHPHSNDFAGDMQAARRDRRGLWAEVKDSQLPAYLRMESHRK